MIDAYRMTGAQLLEEVTLRCEKHGIIWVRMKTPGQNRPGQSIGGFPELFLCGERGAAFRTVKSYRGRLNAERWQWGHRLLTAGENWAVWQPANLSSGDVDRELAELAAS
jgi:hypothetical protein